MSNPENEEEAPGKASGRRVRIWLVEDKVVFRKAVDLVISQQEDMTSAAQYDCFEDAAQALVDGKRPDVILWGLELPEISGIEGIRRIKEVLPEIDMLVFSHPDDEEKVADAIRAGASGRLSRSSSVWEIPGAIREVLDRAGPVNFPDSDDFS